MPSISLSLACAAVALVGPNQSTDLQSVLDETRIAQDVPGVSAVVVRQGDIIFAGGSGVADIATATPMTAESVLYIGSVSKTLTAILVLQLIEDGRLSLTDPVAGIAKTSTRDGPAVSVENLLTHSAGLPREGDFGYWFTANFPDADALTHYLADVQLRPASGASSNYSNVGYAALGLLVTQLTRQRYESALHAEVLEPLCMSSSGGRGPAPEVANGYTPPHRILPSAERPFAGIGKAVGDRYERGYHDARAMSPAFGAYSSAIDMGRLVRFLLGYGHDDVLSPAMRKRMYEQPIFGRGFGFKVQRMNGRNIARQDGWFAAHRSHLLIDLDDDTGVVVLANGDNARTGKIAETLLEAARKAGD